CSKRCRKRVECHGRSYAAISDSAHSNSKRDDDLCRANAAANTTMTPAPTLQKAPRRRCWDAGSGRSEHFEGPRSPVDCKLATTGSSPRPGSPASKVMSQRGVGFRTPTSPCGRGDQMSRLREV